MSRIADLTVLHLVRARDTTGLLAGLVLAGVGVLELTLPAPLPR